MDMEDLVAILGVIFIFGFPVIAIIILGWKSQESKHAERIAMIERGIVPEEAKKPERAKKYTGLRNGLLMIGLALGLMADSRFDVGVGWPGIGGWHGRAEFPVFAILGGGIAFVIYFLIVRRIEKKEE
ncbi:MAG: hypothetical protein LBQ39_10665 [Tannerellaceae bacterium]|jgi:hypothetical protein|nr:hypothetical protein [Tannerellaceae bacterium]